MELKNIRESRFRVDEPVTQYEAAVGFNNFYEFGVTKTEPARNARNFKTSPWTIAVEGLVRKPGKFDMESILNLAPLEERVYRHRCVETWYKVVPWIGYPLSVLLLAAEPEPGVKYVAFESYYVSEQMPEARNAGIPFPYVEGLRMDEAMHPLTLLCMGMYGRVLAPQAGAPVRLIVPWKYGFKGIKSIVKIRLTEKQPTTTWRASNPREYGFYANVNPRVDHPRWSQAREKSLEGAQRDTLMFNGYGREVGSLYSELDLEENY